MKKDEAISLIGKPVGRLTILEVYSRKPHPKRSKKSMALCRCECGNIKEVEVSMLGFRIHSCGCLKKEIVSTLNKRSTYKKRGTHGESQTICYRKWREMMRRCYDRKGCRYKNYGGRGIIVCPEWHDYLTFKEEVMKLGYRDDLTIERKDVNGNYTPENVTFVPMKEQFYNRTTSVKLEYQGKNMCVKQWEEECGFGPGTIRRRLEWGWTLEETLTLPVKPGQMIYRIREQNKGQR